MPSGEGQVAVAPELQAPVSVVRHDRVDDEGDVRGDRAEFILFGVVGKDIAPQAVFDLQHGGRRVADAKSGQG